MNSNVVDVAPYLKRMHVIEQCISDRLRQGPNRLCLSDESLNTDSCLFDAIGGCWKACHWLKTRRRSTARGDDRSQDLPEWPVDADVDKALSSLKSVTAHALGLVPHNESGAAHSVRLDYGSIWSNTFRERSRSEVDVEFDTGNAKEPEFLKLSNGDVAPFSSTY